jgi:hypothetical protein
MIDRLLTNVIEFMMSLPFQVFVFAITAIALSPFVYLLTRGIASVVEYQDFDKELDEILATTFVGFYMTDMDGNFTQVNDKFDVLHDSLKTELKQAVDKYVIGKDLTVFYVDEEPATDIDDINEHINTHLARQRQSLWGSKAVK